MAGRYVYTHPTTDDAETRRPSGHGAPLSGRRQERGVMRVDGGQARARVPVPGVDCTREMEPVKVIGHRGSMRLRCFMHIYAGRAAPSLVISSDEPWGETDLKAHYPRYQADITNLYDLPASRREIDGHGN